jgi:hypothetical protein
MKRRKLNKRNQNLDKSILNLIDDAMDRTRQRCAVQTTYTHKNLASFVQASCPNGWKVHAPEEGMPAISHFPEENNSEVQKALQEEFKGTTLENADFEDMLNGHCEDVAITLARHMVLTIKDGYNGSLLQETYASLKKHLSSMDVANQIKLLFKERRRANLSKRAKHHHPYPMWEDLDAGILQKPEPQPEPELEPKPQRNFAVAFLCAGADPAVTDRIATACKMLSVDERKGAAALPLYVLTYIWDGDELTQDDMLNTKQETAMYSVHCVALVFDGKKQTVSIADPNGPLIPGASMEFVCLPVNALLSKPTTSFSKYDRDQQ